MSNPLLPTANKTCRSITLPASIATGLLAVLPLTVLAAESADAAGNPSFDFWGAVIAVLVLGVAGCVAYLCYASVRLWVGYWRMLAMAPLAALALLAASIAISRTLDPVSRELWPVEMLAWAMLTLIYLVTLFTARRTFEKASASE